MSTSRKPLLLLLCCCLTLLTSCWDQILLKDAKLVMVSGFDLTKEGRLLGTVVIPKFSSSDGGAKIAESQIVSGEGDTTMDVGKELNLKIAGQFDSSKMTVLLFGEDFAKQDIQPGLDVFYRDPRRSLVDNAAVVKGRANDLLNIKLNESGGISEYLDTLFNSAQNDSIIPPQTRPMFSDYSDPATDLILPIIEALEHEVKIIGIALFNGTKYTGKHLNIDESSILMLLDNQLKNNSELKVKIHEKEVPESKNYIYINVSNINRKLKVNGQNANRISAHIQLDLKVDVLEYSKNYLDSSQKIQALEKTISEKLTAEANIVIKKLQEANSDSLAIGRRLIAFHHATWEQIDWIETYPTIEFDARVNTKIINHGIFN